MKKNIFEKKSEFKCDRILNIAIIKCVTKELPWCYDHRFFFILLYFFIFILFPGVLYIFFENI